MLNSGCILYWTYNLTGLIPIETSRSNRDLFSPALAVSLQVTTGPNCRWSPTKMICLAPLSIGNKHSGSSACVASSIKTCWKVKSLSLGSSAVMQVAHITSAELRMSYSAWSLSFLKSLSSFGDSSP